MEVSPAYFHDRQNECDNLKSDTWAHRLNACMMATANADEFTGGTFDAMNGMFLDVLAAVARKDYDDRRLRQAQGQAKAMTQGKYKGRLET